MGKGLTESLNGSSNRLEEESSLSENNEQKYWFVMRDLKRPNAKIPAYKQLADEPCEVFTPLKRILKISHGRRVREEVPFIQDLLFVYGKACEIEAIVQKIPTLQFRYQKGGFRRPMVVRDRDMERFIYAVKSSDNPKYYLPEEITPAMYGHTIQIIGGGLDGYKGTLLTVRGSKTKRLLVELPNFFSVGVEISSEYIELCE